MKHTERANWESVFDPLPLNSESRFCWGLLFSKSTNGVSDKITCNHFRKIIKKVGDLTLDKIIDDEIFICRLLCNSSKQNMNTVAVQNVCNFIVKENKRNFCLKFEELINFRDFAPKTVSLLLYCVFNKVTTVIVNRHVKNISKALGWCHSVSDDDEIS